MDFFGLPESVEENWRVQWPEGPLATKPGIGAARPDPVPRVTSPAPATPATGAGGADAATAAAALSASASSLSDQKAAAPAEEEWATLTFPDGKVHRIRVMRGTDGPPALDIRNLLDATGHITFDPGFTSTGSCESKISFIDGPKGVLSHRGYRIEDLAASCDFMDVTYLLLYGELPSAAQKSSHTKEIKHHTMVHEKLRLFFHGFKADAHPMAIMVGVVGALSAFYHDSLDIDNPKHRMMSAYRLIAKMPTLAAMAYKSSIGQPIVYPRNDLTFAENFLYMMFALPSEPYVVDPVVARALEVIFMLHADHEQNASTSTVRIAGSSRANPYACVSAGISALWGPAHGGANEAVIRMLESIGSKANIADFLGKVKDKNDSTRLMGFGHRVYKNFDPRAKYMKKVCEDVLATLGMQNDPLLELAVELERIALSDEYFIKRKLYPNVDFYSGIVLKAMGFPMSMFTVLFAVARTTGWVANWKEMIEEPSQRIGRPRQLYTGQPLRDLPAAAIAASASASSLQALGGSSEAAAAAAVAGEVGGARVRRGVSVHVSVGDV